MDLRKKWQITHQSICLIEHYNGAEKIASGTGFKVSKTIVTNNHVYLCPPSTHTIIKFVDKDGTSITRQEKYTKEEFQKRLISGENMDGWDYAILDTSNSDFVTIPDLMLCEKEFSINVGSEVYFLGFPLLQNNLSIHQGNISSKYVHGTGVKYLQLDATVNAGNSGGALFDYETDKIIGIVTRKNTGLSKKFDELSKSFADNIAAFNNATAGGGGVSMMGINPLEALKITQLQMDLLSKEIVRSSNVGIGYAFEIDKIRQ